jgi:large subunit ribosomal protein L16
MAFIPTRVKYRKAQRGNMKGIAVAGSTVCFGEYGIKSLENAWLTNTQLETCRVILARRLRRGGKMWIRVFPDKPVSKKPAEVRMGKGKGEVSCWVRVIKRGAVIFEMGGLPEDYARESFHKLSLPSRFVARRKA